MEKPWSVCGEASAYDCCAEVDVCPQLTSSEVDWEDVNEETRAIEEMKNSLFTE